MLNFGWPCYEGNRRAAGYDAADLAICENLYGEPERRHEAVLRVPPSDKVVAGETCPTGSSSISGLAFESRPPEARSRPSTTARSSSPTTRGDCIWAMRRNGNQPPRRAASDVRRRRRRPGRPRDRARTATSTTSTSTVGRSGASGSSGRTSPRHAVASGSPTGGQVAVDGHLRRQRLERPRRRSPPTPGISTGTERTTTRRRPALVPLHGRDVRTVASAGDRPGGPVRHRLPRSTFTVGEQRSPHRRSSTRRAGGTTWQVGADDFVQAVAPRTRNRAHSRGRR